MYKLCHAHIIHEFARGIRSSFQMRTISAVNQRLCRVLFPSFHPPSPGATRSASSTFPSIFPPFRAIWDRYHRQTISKSASQSRVATHFCPASTGLWRLFLCQSCSMNVQETSVHGRRSSNSDSRVRGREGCLALPRCRVRKRSHAYETGMGVVGRRRARGRDPRGRRAYSGRRACGRRAHRHTGTSHIVPHPSYHPTPTSEQGGGAGGGGREGGFPRGRRCLAGGARIAYGDLLDIAPPPPHAAQLLHQSRAASRAARAAVRAAVWAAAAHGGRRMRRRRVRREWCPRPAQFVPVARAGSTDGLGGSGGAGGSGVGGAGGTRARERRHSVPGKLREEPVGYTRESSRSTYMLRILTCESHNGIATALVCSLDTRLGNQKVFFWVICCGGRQGSCIGCADDPSERSEIKRDHAKKKLEQKRNEK
ncbi:hypothetical protein B0H14DRAFT_2617089 [Mycena olivaceomarginata]|nr:hypothetical protein B0H14DRAFT_2617089 [Mycena olivaceomarginata]